MLLPLLAGAASWTLAEYALHRWVGHSPTSTLAFAREHREHHRQREYFAPWSKKLTLAAVVVTAMAAVVLPVLGTRAFVYLLAFVGTWLAYEAIHRDLHMRAPLTPVGRFLRRHHMRHHHVDPHTNHGVTSPLWDLAARSFRPADRVRIPAGRTPRWLANAPPGAAYLADYDVVSAGGAGAPGARG